MVKALLRPKILVQPTGIEPVSKALQASAMTTSARVAFGQTVEFRSQSTSSTDSGAPITLPAA